MPEKYANLAESTLNGTINNSVTSLVVTSASLFPTLPNFRLRIEDEIMLVTGVAGTTFTVTRGIEGTSAASHTSGVTVRHVLTAGALVTEGGWTEVYKTGDESVTGSTALQDDDHLFFTPTSGVFYEVEVDLIYASPVGAGTPDLLVAVGEDTTTTRGVFQGYGFTTADAATVANHLTNNTATTLAYGGAAAKRMLRLRGWILGNGGTFKVRWAQNTSNGNAMTVYTNSRLRYRSLAS